MLTVFLAGATAGFVVFFTGVELFVEFVTD
jgi:hypothetical protein